MELSVLKPRFRDPARRKDGKCAVCRKKIKMNRRPGINPAEYEVDPFCSGECCKKFYDVKSVFKKDDPMLEVGEAS